MKFYCPQCQHPVHLKIGQYNIPHFAHQSKNNCAQLFAEGESQLHLQGKLQLFEWLKKIGHTVMLEPYLKELSQRPDLLVTSDRRQVAIEFQCSTITHEKWLSRTLGYKKNAIQVLWLFQTSLKIHPYKAFKSSTFPYFAKSHCVYSARPALFNNL